MNPSPASHSNFLSSVTRYLLAAFLFSSFVFAARSQELISISRTTGDDVEINFFGALQSSETVIGPWSDESSASPKTITPSAATRYFRIKPFELPAAAHFTVNLETGNVEVSANVPVAQDSTLSKKNDLAASVFGGSTIGFNSTEVFNQAGDPGEKVLSVSLVNQSGRTVGIQPNGIPGDIKVIFSDFKNLSAPSDLRLQTTVSRLAGSDTTGSTDGLALSATFMNPAGVTAGPDGSIYISDAGANKIRKLSHGQVFTLAGSGAAASADGVGTAASFNLPWGIAYSAPLNGLVIADRNGRRVRLLTLDGVVSTIAGTGAAGGAEGTGDVATFNVPIAVAVDGAGAIYVAEFPAQKIRKITLTGVNPRLASNYTVSTWAGSGVGGSADGVGTAAQFNRILGLAAEQDGTLYVADATNLKIRRVSPNQEVVTIAGTGSSGSVDGSGKVAKFKGPAGVALLNGSLAVIDYVDNTVRWLTITPGGSAQNAADWQVRTLAGAGTPGTTDGRGDVAQFSSPFAITGDGAGNLVAADYTNAKLRKVTPTAGYFPVGSPTPTSVTEPVQLSNADAVYTFNTAAGQTFRPSISYSQSLLPGATSAPEKWAFVVPAGVNGFEFNVTVFAPTDTQLPLPAVSNPGPAPGKGSPDVLLSSLAGGLTPGYVNGPATSARFNSAKGIAVDQEGTVYVADSANNAIRRIGKDRMVTTIAGGLSGLGGSTDGRGDLAKFSYPVGIAVTPDGKTLYVTDYSDHTIRRIVLTGSDPKLPGSWSVATIAGSALSGVYVDNTDGSSARFISPSGISWAPGDVLVVSDESRNTVRRLQPQGDNLQIAGSWYVSLVAGDPAGSTGSTDANGSSARFNIPTFTAIDLAGNIYVADFFNYRIRKIDPEGNVTTLAGSSNGYADGVGATAQFGYVYGLAIDNAGYLYVGERDNLRIRRVSPAGIVTTVTGALSPTGYDGTADTVTVIHPWGLAVDNAGVLYAATGPLISGGAFVNPGVRIRTIQRILR